MSNILQFYNVHCVKKEGKKEALSFEGEGTSSWGDPITGTWSILTDCLEVQNLQIVINLSLLSPFGNHLDEIH